MAYGGRPLPNVSLRIYGIDAGATNIQVAVYSDKKLIAPDAVFELDGQVVDGVMSTTFAGNGLKQGLNTFVVVGGEKIGFVRDVNVGFDRVDVEVALRDDAITFDVEPQSEAKTRVRVLRTAINGTPLAKPLRPYSPPKL